MLMTAWTIAPPLKIIIVPSMSPGTRFILIWLGRRGYSHVEGDNHNRSPPMRPASTVAPASYSMSSLCSEIFRGPQRRA